MRLQRQLTKNGYITLLGREEALLSRGGHHSHTTQQHKQATDRSELSLLLWLKVFAFLATTQVEEEK